MPGQPDNATSLTGVLERIVFFNEENAYCIAELKAADAKEAITVLGNLPGVQCGETLKLTGEWVRHPRHGDQFRVSGFESRLPASVHGIRKYLGSGMIHGIGKTYAKKIVDHFGAETLKVISEDSGRLREVPGIGKERAKSIKGAWDEQRAVRDVMMFLQTYGVTGSQCVRLVKKYGNGARRILQDEPYRLVEDIERIGFKTADKIALNLGFPTNSKERVDAGILHTLNTLEDEGHTLGTEATIVEKANELLQVDPGLIATRLRELCRTEKLVRIEARDESGAVIGPACQSPPLAAAERKIAASLARIAAGDSGLPSIRIDGAVEWARERAGFAFAEGQEQAIRRALESKVSIITGGPGTGKTTILRALVEILQAKKARVLLASPTGRAAQRLSEAAGVPAATVHRLLRYDPATGGFVYNEENPLPCDALILDEASMLDCRLAARLFRAVPRAAHLVLVGDADQLPSVGAGNILGDLMAAPPARVTRLDTIFRQGEKSGIVRTAHAILQGETHPGRSVKSFHDLEPGQDVHFIEVEDPAKCLEAVLFLARDYIAKTCALDPVEDIQVMAPMHRGVVGIAALNKDLQEHLNPPERARRRLEEAAAYLPARQAHFREKTRKPLPFEIQHGNATYRLGDKVIQTRNNYDKNVFNGDTGIVAAIAPDGGGLTIRFNGEAVEYRKTELGNLQLAYAITIHKSQGSEYPAVVLPLLKQHFLLLQRNLVYTAITRARQKVFIVGSLEAYAMAVRNEETQVRRTHLRTRLRDATREAADRADAAR